MFEPVGKAVVVASLRHLVERSGCCQRSAEAGDRKPDGDGVTACGSCLQAILDSKQHSISYTLSRNQAVIVEYTHDDETDMFQVTLGPHFVHPVILGTTYRRVSAVI